MCLFNYVENLLGVNFERSLDSICLKHDGIVGTMQNWSGIVLESNRANEKGVRIT